MNSTAKQARLLGWLWLVVAAALCAQQVSFWRQSRLDSDVMALLPAASSNPMLEAAARNIVEGATRQVVVMVGAADFERSRVAANAFVHALPTSLLRRAAGDDDRSALEFFRPYRHGLITQAQRQRLSATPVSELGSQTLSRLYGPGLAGGLSAWRADPMGLWPEWWQSRLGPGMTSQDGWITLRSADTTWILLRLTPNPAALRLDGRERLGEALLLASKRARSTTHGIRILTAGVPLHAEAAAVRANWEMNTIGFGSLAAVMLLVALAFRSWRPILMVSLSLVIGTAAGIAVTAMIFGKVHLLTLVFGASLVGVAEDFGIHYYASRQGDPSMPPRSLMRHLLPGMLLALITSVLAYMALGLAPLPALRQMAVFSAAGLIGAFITVVCWFPLLDLKAPGEGAFSKAIATSLSRWPQWPTSGRSGAIASVLILIVIVGGLSRLHVHDDLRALISSSPALIAQERQVSTLLGLPSPAQFYLVSGTSAQQVLRREEFLKQRLEPLAAQGRIGGVRALSDWVPSARVQRRDAELTRRTESVVLQRVAAQAGGFVDALQPAASSADVLVIDDWLRSPVSRPLRNLWLGRVGQRWGSIVMLEGLTTSTDLGQLRLLADGAPGVTWVDRTSDISSLLARYRKAMTMMLLAGYVLVALALYWRFKQQAWRALVPTVIAALLSLALLGWLGEPLQLFTVLAQFLLLGMGVDYGIFLLEHREDPASWLAVSLGAASTLLAFGLLGLSSTPALHTFGLTMLFGIGLAWLLSPSFKPAPAADKAQLQPIQEAKSMRIEQAQILIIGAGPAGAVAAGLLRKQGIEVLIIEKEQFPRFSIGESLLPQSMEYIEEAGMLQAVVEAGFQHKNGAAFAHRDLRTDFDFRQKFSSGWSTTYQVQRADFDKILADCAESAGAVVRYRQEVTAVNIDGARPVVDVRDELGAPYRIEADFLLDASGFGRVLPRLLQLEAPSNFPVRGALFTHVQDGILAGTFDRNKILVTVHPEHQDVWFWTIPFSQGRCSLGVVARTEFLDLYAGDEMTRLKAIVGEDPGLSALLANATWDTPARKIIGYSANVESLWGNNYALLGNAGEFLDPVFSSGVTIAFKSASLASACLRRRIAGQTVDWEVDYDRPLRAGVNTFRTFVESWYSGGFQKVIFHADSSQGVREMICSILAGYAWDTTNPYVADSRRRLGTLEELCSA